jgi:hypothetical protein
MRTVARCRDVPETAFIVVSAGANRNPLCADGAAWHSG